MKVVIAGGGIGGMALALSLHAAGIDDVDVYESAAAIKELGVGINVLPHAVRELTELGVVDDLASVGIPTAEMVFYSLHGQRIWGEPRGEAAVVEANRRGEPNEVLRIVHDRAPEGFSALEDVISAEELDQIASGYHRAAGFDPEILNNRASLSVR